MADESPVTEALQAWRGGDVAARDEVMRLVYPELHRRAQRLLARERVGHTLQPTALISELYLRLVDQRRVDWHDRAHFFALAARMMRRVLLDHARRRGTSKRGAGKQMPLELAGDVAALVSPNLAPADLEALDEALGKLAALDETAAAVVEMRFFGGLSVEETAAALGTSTATVGRQWRAARAWLHARLDGSGEEAATGEAAAAKARSEG